MINLRALILPFGLCLVAVACGSSSTGGAGGKSGAAGANGAGGSGAACLPAIPTTGTTCTQADLEAYGTCFATQCPAFQACYAAGGACAATTECSEACSTCARSAAAGCLGVCPLPPCILGGGAGGVSGGLGGTTGGLGGSSGAATCLQQLATCCLSAAPAMQPACGAEAQDLVGMGALAETSCGVKLAGLKAMYCP